MLQQSPQHSLTLSTRPSETIQSNLTLDKMPRVNCVTCFEHDRITGSVQTRDDSVKGSVYCNKHIMSMLWSAIPEDALTPCSSRTSKHQPHLARVKRQERGTPCNATQEPGSIQHTLIKARQAAEAESLRVSHFDGENQVYYGDSADNARGFQEDTSRRNPPGNWTLQSLQEISSSPHTATALSPTDGDRYNSGKYLAIRPRPTPSLQSPYSTVPGPS
jgi:hypothetical protein